ncbi:FkbM family methyltransferase [Actinokineospora sp. NBRC 105648]|uniref:FkbM family methyltransferase n=1 Tax=Actinokineospora sp. NBRC 105648 TaxID=3032206 RepID=UPI0024A56D41|nr:FkbM family methyltransferase [Actinokineospora sp. NBRC 105648]GLZ39322.1 hypothetical protein Acsp05_29460 [Actinokineospora sp. NBRC 105648]
MDDTLMDEALTGNALTATALVARGRARANGLADAADRVRRFLSAQVGVTAVETRPASDGSAVVAQVWVADSRSGLPRRALPDGTVLTELNPHETDYVHDEIFVERVYAAPLPAAPVVLDVGANIGLFSLYVARERPAARVYAFEPAPEAYAALVANVADHDLPVTCLPWAVGGHTGPGTMTVYPHAAVFSSLAGDRSADRAAIRAAIATAVADSADPATTDSADEAGAVVDQLADDRMAGARTVPIEVVALADILDRLAEPRVDLLKVDAEGAEVAILGSLRQRHWAVVERIILEVHQSADLADLLALLTGAGYACDTSTVDALRDTGYTNLTAYRLNPAAPVERAAAVASVPPPGPRERLEQALAGLGVPVELTVHRGGGTATAATPGTASPEVLAELAAIWAEVLDRPVRPEDGFFTAGGSSLAAVRMLGRVRARFGGDAGLADLMDDQTLAALAARVSNNSTTED